MAAKLVDYFSCTPCCSRAMASSVVKVGVTVDMGSLLFGHNRSIYKPNWGKGFMPLYSKMPGAVQTE
ncbi:hypothetical protein C2W62_35185 [Candidatus Entotheonella serta]|nr:hypothetical protein C2W62_35185 [Candidatus Entotheonella serta]